MKERVIMFLHRCVYGFLGAIVLAGLGGCIIAPFDDDHEGHGRGRGHDDREGHDRGEHRHDFGVTQREQLGFYPLYATPGAPPARLGVYSTWTRQSRAQGIWG
jgi:hypothetical protein